MTDLNILQEEMESQSWFPHKLDLAVITLSLWTRGGGARRHVQGDWPSLCDVGLQCVCRPQRDGGRWHVWVKRACHIIQERVQCLWGCSYHENRLDFKPP